MAAAAAGIRPGARTSANRSSPPISRKLKCIHTTRIRPGSSYRLRTPAGINTASPRPITLSAWPSICTTLPGFSMQANTLCGDARHGTVVGPVWCVSAPSKNLNSSVGSSAATGSGTNPPAPASTATGRTDMFFGRLAIALQTT